MKLKMPENSLFAILLRSPSWISFAIVAVITLASIALLPPHYVVFGVLGGLPIFVVGVMAALKQWRAPNPAHVAEVLAQASTLSWRDFSTWIEAIYTQQGYAVSRLNSAAADFQLVKGDRITLVSCKRWKAANQGIDAVRDLLAAKDAQGAAQCIYISLGPVTDTAQRFATTHQVTLLSGQALGRLLVEKPRA